MDKDEALNSLAKLFHNSEEMEGEDGAVMVVDLDLWHEGCAAMEFLVGGEEDTGECSSCKHAATPDTLEPCKSCFKEVTIYRNYSPLESI